MSSISISIRTDSELKKQAESILDQLGMTISGAFNMFLTQIVREKSVPLNLSLNKPESIYADLLKAELDRRNGKIGIDSDEMLDVIDSIIAKAERDEI